LARNIKNPEIIENLSAKGTPLYMAPELHNEKEGNSKVDIFSLGIILYRLAFNGDYPFFQKGRRYRSVA
jgi:serine/threonine protein kinase